MTPPRLVIFDCDGVLVDSETIACPVNAALFTELGLPTTADEVMERYLGRSVAFMLADMEARHDRKLPDGFSALMHERIASAFDQELQAIEGVAAAIGRITCAKCVASSGTPQRIERSLRTTGLLDLLRPYLFSATQVKHGKPAPDLFLFAADQMGVPPSDCVVIEDSLAGVEAGRAAGMRVIGFTGGGHCAAGHADALRTAGAEKVISRMAELSAAL